ncbi:hypothetical protein MESS4_360027 [Mesorhizobium sp. STM 4661]|nr:hypothetical protein MESS4_360027 [Mesorhizobium sp. STM 4661]
MRWSAFALADAQDKTSANALKTKLFMVTLSPEVYEKSLPNRRQNHPKTSTWILGKVVSKSNVSLYNSIISSSHLDGGLLDQASPSQAVRSLSAADNSKAFLEGRVSVRPDREQASNFLQGHIA